MHRLLYIFATLFLLPVLAVSGMGSVCHDAHRSLVFDETGDLVVAANDLAVSRFAYDDGHCVVSAETLVGEEVFTTLWRRDAAGPVTNVVYDADRVDGLTPTNAIEHPLFKPFQIETAGMHDPTRVFTGEGEMHNPRFTHREWLRARFLADAIPAESRAAGANAFRDAVSFPSIQMDSEGDAGFMSNEGDWPNRKRGTKVWAHSDFKQVAYFFVYRLFDKFSGTEGTNVVR